VSISFAAQAQTTERVKQRLASSPAEVTIVEQDEAAAAVRAIDQRAKREKVYGYTILLFSDNSPQARENAFKAKEAFEHNFRDTKLVMFYESPSFYVTAGSYLTMEEAVIELNRFRQIFPKAIVQSKELEVKTFTKVEGPRDRVKHDEIVEQIDSTTTTAVVDSLVGKVFVPGA
jgi:hypothetical protein